LSRDGGHIDFSGTFLDSRGAPGRAAPWCGGPIGRIEKEDDMNATMSRNSIRIAASLVLALLAFGPLVLKPGPAAAQAAQAARSFCTERDTLLSQLEHKYGEVPVAIGVADGRLVELLTAKDGITWTLILTSPQGVSCLIASGDGWRPLTPVSTDPAV